jgi:hypothetical protein
MDDKKFLSIFTLLLFFASFLGGVTTPPRITLSVPPATAVEGQAIPLYISIVHDQSQQIDAKQFTLDSVPLTLEAVQQERVAPEELFEKDDKSALVVSRFRALLPPRKAGVYMVGPVSGVINGVTFISGTITVNVQGAVTTKDFRLEMKVEGPTNIYPGRQVVFEYRIIFTKPMRLTREDLPLLQCQGFFNIGPPEVTGEEQGNENVQVIRQKAKAVATGKIEVPVSIIEGMVVESDGSLVPPLLRAQTPGITLNINSFPDKGRPSTFDGALGSFVWRVSVADRENVSVGKPVKVEYRVSGRGDLSTVRFPSFDLLPGINDSFVTEPTPPVGEESEGTKTFILVLKPKVSGNVNVPGFFFTSFDSVSAKYLTTAVPPVSLSIAGGKEEDGLEEKEQTFGSQLAPAFDLNESNIHEKSISVWWVFLAFLVAVATAITEVMVVKKLQSKEKILSSQELFYRALMNRSNKEEGLLLLKQAFYLKLYELKLTKVLEESPSNLQGEGVVKETKNLLQAIDERLYRPAVANNIQELYDEAVIVYHQLKQVGV